MRRFVPTAVSLTLIATGIAAWATAGRLIINNPALDVPLNPFGIKRSPYGEVFAMALQGPIDTHFHSAWSAGSRHHHQAGESCPQCSQTEQNNPSNQSTNRLEGLLTSLEKAVETRTNPKSTSEAHKRYLRRQIEDKLRFAYQLDPSHYGNYNSLHFFLTEPQLGTRPELTPSAAKLAEDTIQYCLSLKNDPRPALTAASATSNILELMFNDRHNPNPKFSTTQMRQYLNLLDFCLIRYQSESDTWTQSDNWKLLSPQRIQECNERLQLIQTFRRMAAATIARLESQPKSTP